MSKIKEIKKFGTKLTSFLIALKVVSSLFLITRPSELSLLAISDELRVFICRITFPDKSSSPFEFTLDTWKKTSQFFSQVYSFTTNGRPQ